MSDFSQVTTHDLIIDGRSVQITLTKTAPTTIRLTWTLPSNPRAYNGAVVLLSTAKITADNYPIDGTRYVGSSNWGYTTPSPNIGNIANAQVVAAFYGFFGDDITQTYVDITNVDASTIYYASIHAASNVLQYFTIGSQSYPLDPVPTTISDTWAGSIPSATVAPQNPYNGQVYFDPTTNMVLVWNDPMSSWIQSNQKTVPVGQIPTVDFYQMFYNYISNELKFFDGAVWQPCTSANTRVKMGSSWAPFNTIGTYTSYPVSPIAGDFAYVTLPAAQSAPATAELKFFSLGAWFSLDPSLIQITIDSGATWISNIFNVGNLYGTVDPSVPLLGDFFYQTTTRSLFVWSGGDGWSRADTAESGTPTPDKIGVGDDGNYEARRSLIQVLKYQVGWPEVCVELSEESFNIAINNALDECRRRLDNAYKHAHVSFTLYNGQVVYYLNDPRNKTDKIVNVVKIHRINALGISSLSAETGLYAQAFFNQLYQGSNVDVVSIYLMNQLSEVYEKIFAGNLMFTWDEVTRELTILRRINQAQERVLLEVVMERTEQELLTDRWLKQWLQGWAQAELWEMLGERRSKYGTLPGANGGITLNGPDLLARSTTQQTELLRQVMDYEVGNGAAAGNASFFIG